MEKKPITSLMSSLVATGGLNTDNSYGHILSIMNRSTFPGCAQYILTLHAVLCYSTNYPYIVQGRASKIAYCIDYTVITYSSSLTTAV